MYTLHVQYLLWCSGIGDGAVNRYSQLWLLPSRGWPLTDDNHHELSPYCMPGLVVEMFSLILTATSQEGIAVFILQMKEWDSKQWKSLSRATKLSLADFNIQALFAQSLSEARALLSPSARTSWMLRKLVGLFWESHCWVSLIISQESRWGKAVGGASPLKSGFEQPPALHPSPAGRRTLPEKSQHGVKGPGEAALEPYGKGGEGGRETESWIKRNTRVRERAKEQEGQQTDFQAEGFEGNWNAELHFPKGFLLGRRFPSP